MANPQSFYGRFYGNGLPAVTAVSPHNIGIYGRSDDDIGVAGSSQNGTAGHFGTGSLRPALIGDGYGTGVLGANNTSRDGRSYGVGVRGWSLENTGVWGQDRYASRST
jgi:hypothetical protein